MKFRASIAAAILCGAAYVGAASAAYTQLYVFGDSLSDTGNVDTRYASGPAVPGIPQVPSPQTNTVGGPGYYDGRFSNGPLYIDVLSQGLGLGNRSTAWLEGGTNYAFGSARTDYNPLDPTATQYLGVTQQAAAFLGVNPVADPNALYVVFGGANNIQDLLRGQNAFGGPPRTIGQSVGDLFGVLQGLYNAGARNFLVPNIPNIGLVPRVSELGPPAIAGATALSVGFNAALDAMLNSLSFDVTRLDTFSLLNSLVANPADYGFTDTTHRCYTGDDLNFTGGGSVCANSADFVFWDGIHPTYPVHQILGQAALAALGIPEPNIVVLLAVALFALIWTSRMRARGVVNRDLA